MTAPRATMTITPTGSRAKYWISPKLCVSYSSQPGEPAAYVDQTDNPGVSNNANT